nr:hypothetical protein [uncultured Brevundimonas sp.]
MVHFFIASIYIGAGLSSLCIVHKVGARLSVYLRLDRHAIVDLLIASGYMCVGVFMH